MPFGQLEARFTHRNSREVGLVCHHHYRDIHLVPQLMQDEQYSKKKMTDPS
jgi:hypothetical protein